MRLHEEAVGGRADHRRAAPALRDGQPPWPTIEADKAIAWVQAKLGVTLAESQQAAVRMALTSKVVVITGGPGWVKPPWSTPS